MGPINKVKTYGRSNNSVVNNSVNAFNTLLAKNMSKRLISKHKKNHNYLIKQLPPRSRCEILLADDSLEISTEDTFDKLLRKNKSEGAKPEVTSESHTSKSHEKSMKSKTSFTQMSTFYSPIMTRTRKKHTSTTELSDKSNITIPDESKGSSNPYLYRLNVPTVDGIVESLEIEKDKAKLEKSSSYLVAATNSRDYKTNVSLNNIFTKTFRERQVIHSSTPMPSQKSQNKIVNHTISPIKNVTCLDQSLEEIKRWDSRFPLVDQSKCSHKRPMTRKRKTLKITSPENSDIFHGFSKTEQSEEDKVALIDTPQNIQQYSKSRVSFITLRKRQIPKYDSQKRERKWHATGELLSKSCFVVSLDTFNSLEIEQNSSDSRKTDRKQRSYIKAVRKIGNNSSVSIKSDRAQRSYKRAERKRILESEESQISNDSNIDNSKQKRLVVSLETFTTFEIHNNSCDSKEFHSQDEKGLLEKELEPSLIFPTKKRKRLTDGDFTKDFTHNFISNNAEAVKRYKAAGFNDFSQREYGAEKNIYRISKDMVVNVTRLQQFNNTESKGCYSFNFEEFFSKNSTFIDKLDNDTVENTSIFNSNQDRKELVVNVTRKYNIPSLDFESFYSKNIFMENSKCANELTNDQDKNKVVADISRKVFNNLSFSESTDKELIVNVTQNIFEDFYSKNYSSDNSTDASGATEYLDEGLSASLFDNVNSHNSTSLIESSYTELTSKIRQTPLLLQVDKLQREKIDKAEPVLMNFSTNLGLNTPCKDISCIDLTESLNEPIKCKLPQTDDTSQISSPDIIDSSNLESSQIDNDGFKVPMVLNSHRGPKTVLLKAGKSWRRSLSNYRRSSILIGSIKQGKKAMKNELLPEPGDQTPKIKSFSIKIIPVPVSPNLRNRRKTILEDYAVNTSSYVPDQILEDNLENSLRCLSIRRRSSIVQDSIPVTAREVVLRRCGQEKPIPFSECYPQSALHHCQKIGEGVYGEVFLYRNPAGGTSVMKVIPIEGHQIVNGERQKKFEEILSEVVIATELSNLRNAKKNATSAFSLVQKVRCVRGRYPEKLLDLWELYEETRGSENDCPDLFGDDQLYVVLELENAGSDLEAYTFINASQAYSMFKQVAFGLAVAEEELRFEHRDLHWGNILLNTVDKNKAVEFCLDGEKYSISSKGVEATIIDFTLSRIEYDGVVIFNDLGLDPDLFTAEGDYQFEIYRLMQKQNRNNWQGFEPYSNLLWLHYTLDKAVTALRYKNARSKLHKDALLKMTQLSKEILTYKSVKDFVLNSLL